MVRELTYSEHTPMKPTAPRTRLDDCCEACFVMGFFVVCLIAPCSEDKNPNT